MARIDIIMDGSKGMGEGKAPELTGTIEVIGAMPKGMSSGRTSVFLIATVAGQKERVFLETSLRMWQMASAAFMQRYGDETKVEQPGDEILLVATPGEEPKNG